MKIGVVIVTYNRLEKLKIALKSYEKQSIKPQYILVVNNNSTDGTIEYLKEWKAESNGIEKIILNLDKNTGGSGGFYEGLKASLDLDAGWIWVADDDAYPKENAFETAKKYIEKYPDSENKISAISGTVLKSDGKSIDCSHRRRIYTTLFNRVAQPYSKISDYEKEEFEINGFSYVGTMINKSKLKQTELTKKDYFIYYDDTEHGMRLAKTGKIICRTDVIVDHDSQDEAENQVTWKTYYCKLIG